MQKKRIAIIGANGQVGSEIKELEEKYKTDFDYFFFTKKDFNILEPQALILFFSQHKIDYLINCSAYTKVDKAEEEKEQNWNCNTLAVGEISSICKQFNIVFIHISTDYVFDGTKQTPYIESDATNPLNEYGRAKLEGEKLALQNNPQSIVFRTSWVYSSFGNNFVKTMINLMPTKESLNIVADQSGSPTYARDIATMLLEIIKTEEIKNAFGKIFHFTNEGIISWFDFANAIKKKKNFTTQLNPIASKDYKTLATRPAYSGLSKDAFKTSFSFPLQYWEESLDACLKLL